MKYAPLICAGLALLAGCRMYEPTPRPDYTIHVVATAQGDKAIPPTCPSYATAVMDPYDNQPVPQFGCAYMRNLAMSVENPDDLLHGRELGPQRGVTAVGALRRYDNNQTRGLIDPSTNPSSTIAATTASSGSSSMTGDVTGGGGGSSGSSAGASSAGAASSATSSAAGP